MIATRRLTATLLVALIAVVLLIDREWSVPLNPYRAPAAVALGSGVAASGAHCSAAPLTKETPR